MRKSSWLLVIASLLALTLAGFGWRHDHLDVGKSQRLAQATAVWVASSSARDGRADVLQIAAQPGVDAWYGPDYAGENYRMLKAAHASSVALLSFQRTDTGADGQILARAAGGAIVRETVQVQGLDGEVPARPAAIETLYVGHFHWWLWLPLAALLWLAACAAVIGRFTYRRRQARILAVAQPGSRSRLSSFAERTAAGISSAG